MRSLDHTYERERQSQLMIGLQRTKQLLVIVNNVQLLSVIVARYCYDYYQVLKMDVKVFAKG